MKYNTIISNKSNLLLVKMKFQLTLTLLYANFPVQFQKLLTDPRYPRPQNRPSTSRGSPVPTGAPPSLPSKWSTNVWGATVTGSSQLATSLPPSCLWKLGTWSQVAEMIFHYCSSSGFFVLTSAWITPFLLD